ncbi:uncharacterized protein LOC124646327 [Helicoverpa zea]|uniref:uncharacterized protein LOC124629804 n=2 Tax=Helicoverpa zea TaxID=7113 RepID=UPI001F59CD67|nr:uncharacterized protein LOC124629804 [Helicoverpa zea]XP_047042407.1 uncharacterized protein LOC124646327 [Helicoverpa zea]
MDPINNTVSGLMDMFHKRMTEFEVRLQKAPADPSNTSNLAAEFTVFKEFIAQALNSLQQQVELLARTVDSMEMRGRRGILLLHGVPEEKDEDTAKVIVGVVKDRFRIHSFAEDDIKRCHRMGRSSSTTKPRPILFKLRDVAVRNNIWFEKTKLKGTGITVSEFLTKPRHDLFMAARKRFGVTKCWTRDGCIYVLAPNGSRHRVTSSTELSSILSRGGTKSPEAASTNAPQKPIITSRPKRAAAIKK